MAAPTAVVIAVGDELVAGRRHDANGERVVRWLEGIGCEVSARFAVQDQIEVIARAVAMALQSGADVIVASGGLGPTVDDVTRDGLAQAFGDTLVLDQDALTTIEQRYRERDRVMPPAALRMAYRPASAEWIANPVGTAPGLLIRRGRTIVVALPGVQREFRAMFERGVLPLLRRSFAAGFALKSAILRTASLPESEVDRRLAEAAVAAHGGKVAMISWPGEVEVMLTVRGPNEEEATADLEQVLTAARAQLGDHLHGIGEATQVSTLRDLLARHAWTLCTAESISGGLLAKRVTDLPGSSAFFLGGVVAYVNREKQALLEVPTELLDRYGAVSGEVAAAMVHGVRRKLGADVAIATTGIAGPSGGSTEKPVGLTYIAVQWPDGELVTRHTFTGDRKTIRIWSVVTALDQARRCLAGLTPLGQVIVLGGKGAGD